MEEYITTVEIVNITIGFGPAGCPPAIVSDVRCWQAGLARYRLVPGDDFRTAEWVTLVKYPEAVMKQVTQISALHAEG